MISLYNTLHKKKEQFHPLTDKKVGIYSCGPTVYSFVHIGNLRAFLCADILKRALIQNGYDITHIMNITDVGHLTGDQDMGEDKLAKAATLARKSAWEIASYYTDAFLSDICEINIILADKYPRATDHIKDMIELIVELEKKGFTYKTPDGIYFETTKLTDYGKLAELDIEGLRAGARVEINKAKHSPTDFALWKFSHHEHENEIKPRRDMEWKSPWGIGFPGWHIECSAMSVKYLGQPFDIHTGGIDHVPVHHTNEIAQSEAVAGKPLAHIWLHNEHLLIHEEKIAKSLGNTYTLENLKNKGYTPLALRYFVLQGHYRSKLNFSWDALAGAQNSLNALYKKISGFLYAGQTETLDFEKQFLAAINDDLNTPKALAVMWNMLNSNETDEAKLACVFEMDKILGLSIRSVWEELHSAVPDHITDMAREREKARLAKNWTLSDKLRQQIESAGYTITDTDNGAELNKKIK